jgi:hypothetical protein
MKTFEKWLEKSKYEFVVRHGSFTTECRIRGTEGMCKVVFNHFKSKGCAVIDDNGFTTEVPSVKKAIELVNFLVDGIC